MERVVEGMDVCVSPTWYTDRAPKKLTVLHLCIVIEGT